MLFKCVTSVYFEGMVHVPGSKLELTKTEASLLLKGGAISAISEPNDTVAPATVAPAKPKAEPKA